MTAARLPRAPRNQQHFTLVSRNIWDRDEGTGRTGMNAHRGTSATGPALKDGAQSTAAAVDPRQVQFRNFGYEGGADEAKLYHGLETPWATQCLFAKLLRRMSVASAGGGNKTNERIPAGYTYLAQFAAHDIIRNSSLSPLLAAHEAERRNE